MAKNEFALAFNEVLDDKQLPKDVVLQAIEDAMISAYRKTVNASSAQHVSAKLDPETGQVVIFAEKEVVDDVQDERTEVTLESALKADSEATLGSIVIVESTPKDFGRVAAQTARQVIQQRIREAERNAQYEHFNLQVGEIVNGIVQSINPHKITLGLDRKAEGIMPRNQQIPGERFRVHDRVRALLAEVKQTPRGPEIILSRAHRNFLRRLLEDEVPEIYHGMVEIRSIAREPGYRSKVAVAALQPGIDPVGACVGIRGVRIQAIVRELNDEKIDVIEWNPDPAQYIAKALSPARVTGVYLDEKDEDNNTATVVVPEDQLSLAIGRDGQNARLAAKLTSWRIDIKSLPEAASEVLFKLANDPEYAKEVEELTEQISNIELILTKKQEGRPVTPEEYQVLGRFVDRVERGAIIRRQEELEITRLIEQKAQAAIPEIAFDIPLDELGLSPRINIMLTGEGYSTIGDLILQMHLDSDKILALNGIGPSTMNDIQTSLDSYDLPVMEEEEEEEIEAVVEAEPEAEEEVEEAKAEIKEVDEVEDLIEAEDIEEEEEVEILAEDEEEELTIDEIFEKSTKEIVGEVKQKPAVKIVEETPSLEDLPEVQRRKKDKRKRYREVEYDPEHDVTIVKRKRKRDPGEWEEEWEDW
jgi:N utilization substance protein A